MAVRTVKFSSVLAAIFSALRVEEPTARQSADALAAINLNLETGWKYDFWPELTAVEQRAFRPAYDATVLYVIDDIVWLASADKYYTALEATQDQQPDENPAIWAEITDFRKYVTLDGPGETPIDEIEGVYRNDPRLNTGSPGRLDYALTAEGLVPLAASVPARVWVQFRLRPSVFTLTPYAGTMGLGDIAYDADTGECYQSLVDDPGADLELPEEWALVPFPAFLKQYLVLSAKADLLDGDGQDVKAARARADAYDKLVEAHDHQFPGQSQSSGTLVQTY